MKPLRKVPYYLLTGIELLIDATGAVTNTDNDYATIDGSGNVTAVKSVSPGTTGRNFTVVGSGVTLGSDGSFAFNGSGRLLSSSSAATWDFMSYKATAANIKYTIFAVVKFGSTIRPAAQYGLLGNTGGSSANKGALFNYNNSTQNDNITGSIVRGTSAQYVARAIANNIGISNKYFVLTIKVDISAESDLKIRFWINDQTILYIEGGDTATTPVTTPTYALEIGGAGNSVIPMVGNIKELIIANSDVSGEHIRNVSRALMNKHNITKSDANFVSTDIVSGNTIEVTSNRWEASTSTRYYFNSAIGQNPTSPYNIVSVYTEGTTHVFNSNKRVVGKISTDKAKQYSTSFSDQFTIFDPTAPSEGVQGGGGGYDHNGRFHYFVDTHTSNTVGSTNKAYQIYTDNNGINQTSSDWTPVDITSSLESDGLNTFRMVGGMIVNNGVWIKPYYKVTDEGDATESAIYILRSTNGTTWTSVTVKAKNSTYHNESWVVALDNDNLILVARNEVTNEWYQYASTDNGLTWSAQGDVNWGLTITSANPVCLKWFNHKGQRIIVAYVPDRDNDVLYAIYAKASSLIASGVSGWDLDTKIPIWKTNETGYHLHYGDVCHINNTANAIGMWPYDQYPPTGAGTVNELYYFTMGSWQLPLIETELGL